MSATNLRTRQLAAFHVLAAAGSFTAAAVTLNTTQSALSKQIKDLEAQLGTRLLDRTTRRVALTREGEDFLAATASAVAQIDAAVRDLREQAAGRRGRLSLSATPHIAATLLPPILARMLAARPRLNVTCLDTLADEGLRLVAEGDVEFAVTAFRPTAPLPTGLAFTPVWETHEDLVVVLPAGHPLVARHAIPWEALMACPLVTLHPGGSAHTVFEELLWARQPELKPRLQARYVSTVLGMVAAGLGVAVFPSSAVSDVRSAALLCRPLEGERVWRQVATIHRAGRSLSGPAKLFVAELRGYLASRGSGR